MSRSANIKPVACPGSSLGEMHNAVYDLASGRWRCGRCGLAGDVNGFTRLNALEAERHRLANELEIMRFEQELAERESAPPPDSLEEVLSKLEALR